LARIGLLIFVLVCVAVVMLSDPVSAQPNEATDTPAVTDEQGSVSRLFDHFVGDGGLITWFILIPLSLVTIALIVEHSLSIRQKTIVPDQTLEQIHTALADKQYIEIIQATATKNSLLESAINEGLSQASNGYSAMQRTAADVIDHGAGRLMRKIEYLNVIGNVSPMVGLFGTVYGMIGLFASIHEAGGIPDPARIADDISVALVTTFWGLLVAIPALSMFAFFRNRIDELTAECSSTIDRLLSVFDPSQASAEQPQPVTV